MFVKKKREFFFFWTETKRERARALHGWSDAKRHERTREIMRREGRDLPKVSVQGRRRCNPSSLMQFQLKRTRGRAREIFPFSWCNQTKREEERVAKIREKLREKFERVSPREEDAICERSHPFIKEWMAKIASFGFNLMTRNQSWRESLMTHTSNHYIIKISLILVTLSYS
jgi:hypothetical protein